jgi:hypothetical protein
MVGEYFPWSGTPPSAGCTGSCSCSNTTSTQHNPTAAAHRSHFIYTQANHKSVLGIGAYAKQAGAELHCVTKKQMDAWLALPGCPAPEQTSRRSSCCGCVDAAAGSASEVVVPANTECRAVRISKGQQQLAGTVSLEEPLQPATPALSSSSSSSTDEAAGRQQELLLAARNTLDRHSQDHNTSSSSSTCHLVAYPAKDNYEGRLYPQQWVKQVGRCLHSQTAMHCSALRCCHSLLLVGMMCSVGCL